MMLFRIVSGSEVSSHIDSNTVGLLVGMMVVVGILSKTGIFQYIAVKAIKVTKGNGTLILLSVSLITALLSAFLDNVTTVLLVSPVVVSLAELIKINPLPLLLCEVIASNIGGTATLIGDPPNMIIGSYAGFSFNDFIIHLSPLVVIVWVFVMAFLCWLYRKDLIADKEATERLREVNESRLIKDKGLMIRSCIVMAMVLIGFVFHHHIGITASVVALFAAGLLLAMSKLDDGEVIHKEVEWPTIVYFVSLFILVGGLQENGRHTLFCKGALGLPEWKPYGDDTGDPLDIWPILYIREQRGFCRHVRTRGKRDGEDRRDAPRAPLLGACDGMLPRGQRELSWLRGERRIGGFRRKRRDTYPVQHFPVRRA